MTTAIIGDVHGCSEELEELLAIVQPLCTRIVFLGDFMDRGPDPVGVVQLVRAGGYDAIASNHDEKHVRYRGHEVTRRATGKKNPIRFTNLQAEQHAAMSDDDIAWLAGLPYSLDLGGGWRAVHAGLEPCKSFDEQKDSPALLRTRFINDDGSAYTAKDRNAPDPTDKWFWSDRWCGPESIVYGHHIHSLISPRIQKRTGFYGDYANACIGIDTGCYAGGRLTAMVLADDGSFTFEHVDAKRVYEPLSDKYGANKPSARSSGEG